jgi:hypothetical protein
MGSKKICIEGKNCEKKVRMTVKVYLEYGLEDCYEFTVVGEMEMKTVSEVIAIPAFDCMVRNTPEIFPPRNLFFKQILHNFSPPKYFYPPKIFPMPPIIFPRSIPKRSPAIAVTLP